MSNTDEQLSVIGRLDAAFGRAHLDYWLFGGWAVDFHAGVVSRDHDDVDIAVWHTDSAAVRELLTADGWEQAPAVGQDGYETYALEGMHLDVAFLARDRDTVYTPLRSGRGDWPVGSFGEDVRELEGRRARVVTARSLMIDKSQARDDVASAAKDAADVAVLRARTGQR